MAGGRARHAKQPDPLYGERYLPRKFKIGLAIPEDNTIDVLTNDLAIVALWEGERLAGYNFLLGGGHGMTHNNPKTYPRLATPVAFVEPDDLLDAAAAVVRLHRDYGDRGNRRHARLKYVIAEQRRGLGARAALANISASRSNPAARCRRSSVPDHLGWHEQGDGKLYLGIPVSSGRIVDGDGSRLRTALREIVADFRCDPILMPSQDIILSEIRREDRDAIDAVLRAHGVRLAEDMLPAERWALACPALPTCGLALTEAERVRDEIVDRIEARLRASTGSSASGSASASPAARMAALGPIPAISALSVACPGYYALFVGGDFEGTRLNTPLADKVAAARRSPSASTRSSRSMPSAPRRRRLWRFLPSHRHVGAASAALAERPEGRSPDAAPLPTEPPWPIPCAPIVFALEVRRWQ